MTTTRLTRRPQIRTSPPDPGDGWRLLEWGECVIPGDEWWIRGRWIPVTPYATGIVWHDGNPRHPASVHQCHVPARRQYGEGTSYAPLVQYEVETV